MSRNLFFFLSEEELIFSYIQLKIPVLITVCTTFELLRHAVSAKKNVIMISITRDVVLGDTELNVQYLKTNQSSVPLHQRM